MITVNGKTIKLEKQVSVSEYLTQNQYQPNRIAVELNGKIVPKASYGTTVLNPGDVMEIVSFVGGG